VLFFEVPRSQFPVPRSLFSVFRFPIPELTIPRFPFSVSLPTVAVAKEGRSLFPVSRFPN
jgi:hypothetical protein